MTPPHPNPLPKGRGNKKAAPLAERESYPAQVMAALEAAIRGDTLERCEQLWMAGSRPAMEYLGVPTQPFSFSRRDPRTAERARERL